MILNLQNIFTKASNIVIKGQVYATRNNLEAIYIALLRPTLSDQSNDRLVQTDAKKLSFEGLVVF